MLSHKLVNQHSVWCSPLLFLPFLYGDPILNEGVYILESHLKLQYFMETIISNDFCKNNMFLLESEAKW